MYILDVIDKAFNRIAVIVTFLAFWLVVWVKISEEERNTMRVYLQSHLHFCTSSLPFFLLFFFKNFFS